jgi:phage virion morphogenesis protein
MAADGVRIELKSEDIAQGVFARAADRAVNAQPMWEDIGASLVTSTQHRFERGVRPDGSPWPPSMRALAEGGKTLVESTRLMLSLTSEATGVGVMVGTNVLYAAAHQFGADIQQGARTQTIRFKRHKRSGKLLKGFRRAKDATEERQVDVGAHTIHLPARPFLGLDDDDQAEIARIVEDWLTGPGGLDARQ